MIHPFPWPMGKKVAYAVLIGRVPGIYDTWQETSAQVNGFSGGKQKGYTVGDGGRAAAERAFRDHIRQNERSSATSNARSGFNSLDTGLRQEEQENGGGKGQRSREQPSLQKSSTSRIPLREQRVSASGTLWAPQTEDSKPFIPESDASMKGAGRIRRKKKERPTSWEVEKDLRKGPKRSGDMVEPRETATDSRSSGLNRSGRPFLRIISETSSTDTTSTATSATSSPQKSSPEDHNHEAIKVYVAGKTFKCPDADILPDSIQEDKHDSSLNGIKTEGKDELDLRSVCPSSKECRRNSNHDFSDGADYVPFVHSPSDDDISKPSLQSISKVPPTEPELCQEQRDLIDLITTGRNVFYTGSAGCGKSTVLRAFVNRLRGMGRNVTIVSPSGCSALGVGGMTFWTYAGWRPASMKEPIGKLADNARFQTIVREWLCETDVLVIDEISMIENHHLERINAILKAARSHPEHFPEPIAQHNFQAPFGGVQVIVTGDFFQLPPVKPFKNCMHCGNELKENKAAKSYHCPTDFSHGPYYDVEKWAFLSSAWRESDFEHVQLTQIHRQVDEESIKMLQNVRFGGYLSAAENHRLLHHLSDTSNAVKLFPKTAQVKWVNDQAFSKLDGPEYSFNCLDSYFWNAKDHRHLKDHWQREVSDESLTCQTKHRFERLLRLKPNMLVVLLANLDIDRGLVNGAQGIILGFKDHDPEKIPEHYSDLQKKEVKQFASNAQVRKWPLVRFRNRSKTVDRLIKPFCVVDQLGDTQPYSWVSRTQIPLIAGWALSIHKSQGMTLARVEVDLSECFDEGRTYVALSRATSLSGLKVHALGKYIKANPQVLAFHREKFGNHGMNSVDATMTTKRER